MCEICCKPLDTASVYFCDHEVVFKDILSWARIVCEFYISVLVKQLLIGKECNTWVSLCNFLNEISDPICIYAWISITLLPLSIIVFQDNAGPVSDS